MRRFRRPMLHALVLGSALALAGSAVAATLLVDDDRAQCPGATYTTIQAAVSAAASGDVVDVCPGTYGAFGVPSSKQDLTVRSTAGPATTLVRGYANGCYGILIGEGAADTHGITIEGFDVATLATLSNGCDWSAIATSTARKNWNTTIRGNVIHEVMQPGSKSCSGSYGVIGLALNNVHGALVEGNTFRDVDNEGCTPGVNINCWSSAVQVIFASGENGSAYGVDDIVIQDNVIESAEGFNALGIRVKRSRNFAILRNEIGGLVSTDGTGSCPSATRALHPQGQSPTDPMIADIRGDLMDNTLSGDLGVVFEATDATTTTGNDMTGVALTHAVFANADGNYVCENALSLTANFAVVDQGTSPPTPSTGNTFPGGGGFPGNLECNRPPVATAGGPYDGACSDVALDGATASDPDFDELSFEWSSTDPDVSFSPASGTIPAGPGDRPVPATTATLAPATLPCGVSAPVTLVVTDPEGKTDESATTVTFDDDVAPEVDESSADLYCLAPRNHEYRCFTKADFAPDVEDSCSPVVSWRFVGCASDQPDHLNGGGDRPNDCVVAPDGESFKVRSETATQNPAGRRYTVTIVATDACGNESAPTPIGQIHVPQVGSGTYCLRPNCGK